MRCLPHLCLKLPVLRRIAEEEGAAALWRGWQPRVLFHAPSGEQALCGLLSDGFVSSRLCCRLNSCLTCPTLCMKLIACPSPPPAAAAICWGIYETAKKVLA